MVNQPPLQRALEELNQTLFIYLFIYLCIYYYLVLSVNSLKFGMFGKERPLL